VPAAGAGRERPVSSFHSPGQDFEQPTADDRVELTAGDTPGEPHPVAVAPDVVRSVPAPPDGDATGALSITDLAAETDTISDLPLSGHAEVYQRVHAGLQQALADIDGH
jgi:hypothetical protein